MAKKKTVQMHDSLVAVKDKTKKMPNHKDLEKIQQGINKAGNQAIKESQSPELKKASEIMARRLEKIDKFVSDLVKEEGADNLSPQQVTEILMIKARHNAFIHCAENDPSKVLLWLIEMVLFNADAIFAVTKAHLVAQNDPEITQVSYKHEKKYPKKKK